MKKILTILISFITMAITSQVVTYTPSIDNFSNPERGFYKYSKAESTTTFSFLSQSSLTSARVNDKITLVLRIYDLGAFKTIPISQTFLDNIQTDFNTLRTAGVKCVLRFRYTETDAVDATKSIILSHIDQLKAITIPNQDVISCVEAGFIGQYGEWYYTTNFGNNGILTSQNITDRTEVGLKIMELAPKRLVMFRTPYFQQMIAGNTPLSLSTSYNSSILSRTALHNDAFLSSNSDSGTFKNTTTEYTYLDAQSKYTFCGGESNALFQTKQDCSVVFGWLTRFHYNYLNFGYHPDVISLWKANGCYDEITRRLGYRFELINSSITNNVLNINLKNVGFANVYNYKQVYLVLVNQATGFEYNILLNTDIRRWNAGETISITQLLNFTNIQNGVYDTYLWIPDNVNSYIENNLPLPAKNPIYSIRLANTGLWISNKGYNNLNQVLNLSTLTTSPPLEVRIYVSNYNIFVVNLSSYTLAIYNLNGKLVSTSSNISNLKRGIYIIKAVDTTNGKIYTQKIYKK